ncbi:addiction module protein [Desulfococcaceae bacterium HSG7]|nr:addiction module protein [Desulfococcaceae bacterium HSG7]
MLPEIKTIEKQALQLPIDDKVVLTETLLESIYAEKLIDVEESWLKEVEKRYNGYSEEKAEGIQVENIFSEIRKELGWEERNYTNTEK